MAGNCELSFYAKIKSTDVNWQVLVRIVIFSSQGATIRV